MRWIPLSQILVLDIEELFVNVQKYLTWIQARTKALSVLSVNLVYLFQNAIIDVQKALRLVGRTFGSVAFQTHQGQSTTLVASQLTESSVGVLGKWLYYLSFEQIQFDEAYLVLTLLYLDFGRTYYFQAVVPEVRVNNLLREHKVLGLPLRV